MLIWVLDEWLGLSLNVSKQQSRIPVHNKHLRLGVSSAGLGGINSRLVT